MARKREAGCESGKKPVGPRKLKIDEGNLERCAMVYGALSDPIRLRILGVLTVQPLCVCFIKEIVNIPDSKLSYHLGILRSAGLVESQRDGNWIMYSLTELGNRHAKSTSSG